LAGPRSRQHRQRAQPGDRSDQLVPDQDVQRAVDTVVVEVATSRGAASV
jgi:hypothetical protein